MNSSFRIIVLLLAALMTGALAGQEKPGNLALTNAQKQQLFQIQAAYYVKIDALEKQIKELRAKQKQEMEEILTDEQKKHLQKIVNGEQPCAGADAVSELEKLAGTWASPSGSAELVITASGTARVTLRGAVEFDGKVGTDAGKLTLYTDAGAWLTAGYRLTGDRLTLEIDGTAVDYRRKK
jgi:TolA-binding protein